MASSQRLGRIVAALLVLGAALFVLGVVLEPGDRHQRTSGYGDCRVGRAGRSR
jgi:hypothetical protein